MKLRTLDINITSTNEFLNDLKLSIYGETRHDNSSCSLSFDSIETVKKVLTQNRLEILMAIAREKPGSIYELAKFLHREHNHVVKDCKTLEAFGFIFLDLAEGSKRQYIPNLSFDYDLIRVKSKLEEFFPISSRCNQVLSKSIAI